MNAILTHATTGVLVGVIDILQSRAVHAVAGQRHQYQQVPFCDGDPLRLAAHYRDHGIRELYLADLDAIAGRNLNADVIRSISDLVEGDVIVDCGWGGEPRAPWLGEILECRDCCKNIRWVAATESMTRLEDLACLVDSVTAARTILGLDYRMGKPLRGAEQGDAFVPDQEWIKAASGYGCFGSVVLDLAQVGTAAGPTTGELCRQLKISWPEARVYSGGGLRSANDVRQLQQFGCDRCLVATALYPAS